MCQTPCSSLVRTSLNMITCFRFRQTMLTVFSSVASKVVIKSQSGAVQKRIVAVVVAQRILVFMILTTKLKVCLQNLIRRMKLKTLPMFSHLSQMLNRLSVLLTSTICYLSVYLTSVYFWILARK